MTERDIRDIDDPQAFDLTTVEGIEKWRRACLFDLAIQSVVGVEGIENEEGGTSTPGSEEYVTHTEP